MPPQVPQGGELLPSALEELEEELHIVQPDSLNPRGQCPEEEHEEHLGHEEGEHTGNHDAYVVALEYQREEHGVEGQCHRTLPEGQSGQPRVRHKVREQTDDL